MRKCLNYSLTSSECGNGQEFLRHGDNFAATGATAARFAFLLDETCWKSCQNYHNNEQDNLSATLPGRCKQTSPSEAREETSVAGISRDEAEAWAGGGGGLSDHGANSQTCEENNSTTSWAAF